MSKYFIWPQCSVLPHLRLYASVFLQIGASGLQLNSIFKCSRCVCVCVAIKISVFFICLGMATVEN